MEPWSKEFETILRPYLYLLPEHAVLAPDASMQDLGLDSLGTVSLLVAIEEKFEVFIPDEAVTDQTFATPAGLWSIVLDASRTTEV